MLEREKQNSYRMIYEDNIQRLITPCPQNRRVGKATDASGKELKVTQNFETNQIAVALDHVTFPINIDFINGDPKKPDVMTIDEPEVTSTQLRAISTTPSSQVLQSDPLEEDVY